MAEVAALDQGKARGVRCPSHRLAALRETPRHSIRDVLTTGQVSERIFVSLEAMLSDRPGSHCQVRLDAWTLEDAANVKLVRDEYLRSWALCYLLHHNPNYADRFRLLGNDYLTRQRGTFENLFAPMAQEIIFEYEFFLRRVDVGYRVDLCRWDWQKPCLSLDDEDAVTGRCVAARGWQTAGVRVTKGRTYAYDADGSWSTQASIGTFDANGSADGSGKLLAVVMRDFQLSEPFKLGRSGTFVAPETGSLHLRCGDAWNELGDNRGEMRVRFTHLIDDVP
jgi:hypothetical protein